MTINRKPLYSDRSKTTNIPAVPYQPLLVLILALLIAAILPTAAFSVTVSGHVRTADGLGLEGVSVWGYTLYGYPSISAATDAQGFYQMEVPLGQSLRIGVNKHLYTFGDMRYYDALYTDVTDADFVATKCIVISGYVRTADGTPVQYAWVEPISGGQPDSTDEDGFYQLGVPSGWTGTLQVTKDYYTFNPPQRSYENVTADLAGQDIEAIPYSCISGYVKTTEGEPVEGVVVRTPDIWDYHEDNICFTDANGYYSLKVPPGWSGRMYAEKWTYLFEPTEKNYQDVTSDVPEQNYTAIPFKKISGHVRTADGTPVEGVSVLSHNENGSGAGDITEADGYYSVSVPPGWSGGIEVYAYNKPFSFDPADRLYENVTEDITDQDVLAIPFIKISGYVRTGDGTPISDATVYSNYSSRAYTDANGFYSVLVPRGSSGIIGVDKRYYKMEPDVITYENVTSALSNRNFTALPYLTIQGTVRTLEGQGVAAYLYATYDGISASADENGNYTCLVPPGWSGSLNPELLTAENGLYVFEPKFKTYENVSSSIVGQDFTAIPYVTISGYVKTADGQPLESAMLYADGISANSDSNGYYMMQVPPGWSGTVSPYKALHAFTPTTRTYQNLTTDQTDQNYTGAPYKMISGHIRMADGSPAVSVSILRDDNVWVADVDSEGYYSAGVPPGWSGILKATGSYMAFEPVSRSFSNVQADIVDQDYTGIRLHKISGCIRGVNGERVDYSCVRASGVAQEFLVGSDGRYVIGVLPGWSGTVTPEGWFFEMEPKSRSYTNVSSDIPDQDYAATPVSKTPADIKKSPDGTYVICPIVRTTACFDDCIYVSTATRDFSIKVCIPGIPGTSGSWFLTGFLSTDSNGERCLIPSYMSGASYMKRPDPIYMNNRSIGGSDWFYNPAAGTGQQGCSGSVGLNNIGLLVKTSGQVIEQGDGWFRISDGSGPGLKCILPEDVVLSSGTGHVVVTGISSCLKNENGTLQQVLRVRSQDDIVQ